MGNPDIESTIERISELTWTRDRAALEAQWVEDARFEPRMATGERDALLHGWRRAVERSKAREPFLASGFSRREVNTRFRNDEHRRLMHQWY